MNISAMAVGVVVLVSFGPVAWSELVPRITVRTLAGSPVLLPDDLEGKVDILVVGFTRKAGDGTRPWTERFDKDFARQDGFAVYPVAVLAGVPALFRSFALGSIRSSVPAEQRYRFLIVDQDEQTWRGLAGYRRADDPYIIVIDKVGSVLARASGLFDEKSYQELAAWIRSVVGGKS